MKFSELIIPTLREAPADAEVASHILLVRGGFIRRLASGSYNWLPLGLRVLKNIERIVREELERAGAQEILMPVVQPAELWRESGRWDVMGPELLRLTDRHDREYCVSPTQEEVVTDLFRRVITSYRQLPCNLYHIQTKFRDEIRPRFGLMRAREFIMKDGYSFHLDEESFEATYSAMHACYSAILTRMGLDYRAVDADSGSIGDGESHEFHVLAESGEDKIAYSPMSDYAANVEKAQAVALPGDRSVEAIQKVHTPGAKTIEAVAEFLGVDARRCVKTLIVHADSDDPGLVALVLRGDHQLNEAKAGRIDGVRRPLEFAGQAEIEAALGVGIGSIGPVELALPMIADSSAASMSGFVCGANADDYHYVGANWQRDVASNVRVADIRNVVEGDPAPDGSGPLSFLRGIEVGHIFKLGTKYSETMGVTVQNASGRDIVPIMGCYGFGVSRMVAAVVEQCHDGDGIVWPDAVAPFDVHVVALNNTKSADVQAVAERLHRDLQAAGLAVLFDDRDERPGVKFADADLIGIPNRVTVGDRGLKQGIVEYRRRSESGVRRLSPDAVVDAVASTP
ncbi:MAG: proline--tRNA ligase [Gammaproteobacteria bacterium]|nr:proline--tRNA ligase [Gammaproteobacteria bacterium]MYF28623.1 proline--tRNA ligase [Gammaproteobacteria bacterium]MYK47318.1 proline--tRNA ligase [Gammaproteobacteria bacterium]